MKVSTTFRDPGLGLGVLQSLLIQDLLGSRLEDALESAAVAVRVDAALWIEGRLSTRPDLARLLRHGVRALCAIDVTTDELARLRALDFDGGNEIYEELEVGLASALELDGSVTDSGGEGEHYAVREIDGVLALPQLRSLSLDAHGFTRRPRSLAPLRGHATLEALAVAGTRTLEHDALLELPRLRTLRWVGCPLEARVAEALRVRGVIVT
ncbi:MAG: hypothetical protein K1X94_04780 [Sandaracinaceae bacterium]|nr:hypothetical protein [Sandaracinaceae bacterium]